MPDHVAQIWDTLMNPGLCIAQNWATLYIPDHVAQLMATLNPGPINNVVQ